MKKLLFFFSLFFLLSPVFSQKVCAVYFTFTHCSNCEYTDPIVLDEWVNHYDDLVIIEYVYEDWTDPNGQVLGQYSQNYNTHAAVPQLVISEDDIRVGRYNVPTFEQFMKSEDSNPCVLLEESVSFSEMNLNELPAEPKIWANGRMLMKTGDSVVSSSFLRDLLTSSDLDSVIEESSYDVEYIEPVPAPISGGEIIFNHALRISDSWILEFNEYIGGDNKTLVNESEEETGNKTTVDLGFLGKVSADNTSLPIFTILIAGADAFNPCAFFILTFLLSAVLYVRSRKRILIVGGIFVFFSGLIYYLFMAAWLNVFLIAGQIAVLTTIAGLIALFAGAINIKDYFAFQKGISLTLPKESKKMMEKKVSKLKKKKNIWGLIIGTVILAVTINMYELLCTVGFPMIFTRILTMSNLSTSSYYLYILLYNIVYIIPLTVIVVLFAITLGSRKISKKNIKRLKLVSGTMITFLGVILLFKPQFLESALTGFGVLISALIASGLIITGYEGLYCNYCHVNEYEGEEQCPHCGKWFKRIDLHKCKEK